MPRRSADRRRVTPGSFSADQAERLRRVVMSGKSRFACPNCEQTLDIDPPTSVRGTNVWEVHCAGCFRSAMITDTKRTSVMIVDDESLIRETLATVVMRAGHDVTDFADGASALIAYRDSPADVVLLDMLMPKMPGIDFMRALQREFPEAKVIAMSGQRRHGAPDPLATAKKLGAVRILRKPFTPPELLRALDEVVGAGRRSAGY